MIRWNSFVFLPVIQSIYGPDGLALAAVVIAAMIPVTNILCVIVLVRWGADQRAMSPLSLVKAILSNPILIACLVGLALNLLERAAPPRHFRHARAPRRRRPAAGPDRRRAPA